VTIIVNLNRFHIIGFVYFTYSISNLHTDFAAMKFSEVKIDLSQTSLSGI
jgi:hypothetical protein